MLQGFYSAAVGAQQQMERMNVHANNIANVNTYGFKTQSPGFQALMYGMLDGIDGSTLPKGSGAKMAATTTDMADGTLEETGRDQDYAIVGSGFFALYEPESGQVSFTRDGSFTITALQEVVEDEELDADQLSAGEEEGPTLRTVYYLTDGEGRQVLGSDGYPIEIMDKGEAQPNIGVFNIQYLDGLERAGSERFIMNEKNGAVWNSDAQVRRGFLESSNADLATELSGVIEAQRSYSYILKMMTTADEVETTINNLTNG